MLRTLQSLLSNAPLVDFWSVRYLDRSSEDILVRQNVLMPLQQDHSSGLMITVFHRGGLGYAATADISQRGIQVAFEKAKAWAEQSATHTVLDTRQVHMPKSVGEYQSPVRTPCSNWSLTQKIDYLQHVSSQLKTDDRIVDWDAYLGYEEERHLYIASNGSCIEQHFSYLAPGMSATANEKEITQTRSLGGLRALCRQGGLEVLEEVSFADRAKRLGDEAVQLLLAPNCPTGKMSLMLDPGQMMLQIHESIGHPLELDRILGDERNYAGTSFVTLDMFGKYQYGSPLLNITFDPSIQNEFASYAFDDEGLAAEKTYLIKNGLLERPLGGTLSQARAGMPGVANSRACNWNRPPIDRMANLNLETGSSTLKDMISSIENGVLMHTNVSWSIDDSRNKFQFGCEWGQRIENGKLTHVVRNPNYRGISATFWRNLSMVGNAQTRDVLGTPYCGKGEPNQCVRVGHASPTCVFDQVDVFGGE